MSQLKWIKSSFSEASGNNCIETAEKGQLIAMRDSRHPDLVHTSVWRNAWSRFAEAAAGGLLAAR
ncbi:DUF397 domain-containing protein [Streptomyces broussonetiae]|uniref:DUF397 domain-containing protein n=1 Tax=Streptomyces broussonetiae TaxID=2686304 RepID=A0A6I6N939_9ACTN|nr:DUF397 domain-containing protein [Streptomyces broussonetiae]